MKKYYETLRHIAPLIRQTEPLVRQVEPLIRQIEPLIRADPLKAERILAEFQLFNVIGQFNPPKDLSPTIKSVLAQHYAYSEWARVALDVANQYYEGDYFEFGSEGLNTLCNFLVAFHMNGHETNKPNVRFFAFDVFGDPGENASLTASEDRYFNAYKKGPGFYKEMQDKLHSFGLMEDRVELVKGYFNDTLSDVFKDRLRSEQRQVGFAFLDCNIGSSYKTCLDFLIEFIHKEKSFIYLDEYFQFGEVANLFDEFCDVVRERHGLKARYIRTAGAYGALFALLK